MDKYDVAIIDGQNMFYKAFSVHGALSTNLNGEEVFIGGVFGFFQSLVALKRDYLKDESQILVAWDRGYTRRTELYPEYKQNRNKDEWEEYDNFKAQLKMLKKILSYSGAYQIEKAGEEADDIVGSLSILRRDKGDKVIMFSADKDYNQLIDDNIDLLAHKGKANTRVWNKEQWIDMNGFHPKYYSYILALMGDKGDNIPGIPGIGEKTANKLVCENMELIDALIHEKEYKQFIPAKLNSSLKKLLLKENIELLVLSYKLAKIDKEIKGMKIKKGARNFDLLEDFFEIAKFNSLLKEKSWEIIKNF